MAEVQYVQYNQVKFASLSYTWTIRNFPSCVRDVGHFLTMDEVSITPGNKIKCYLTAYPKGEDKESENYLSMFLNLTANNNVNLFLAVSFKLLFIDSENVLRYVKPQMTALFTKTSCTHGWKKFINTGDLLKNEGLLLNDTLRIHCEINISTEVQESSLTEDLSYLYVKQSFSDVTLTAEGKEFKVHKGILAARSSTFAAILSKEKNQDIINFPEIDKSTMNSILHYIYSGKAPDDTSVDSVCKVLAAAEKYDLAGLKSTCEKILCSRLTTDNVSDLLVLANAHRASQLKETALEFISSHIVDLRKKESWMSFVQTQPGLLNEVFGYYIQSTK